MAVRIEYYSGNELHQVTARRAAEVAGAGGKGAGPMAAMAATAATVAVGAMAAQHTRVAPLFHTVSENTTLVAVQKTDGAVVIATETIVVEGSTKAELRRLKDEFGMEVVDEGLEGKVVLRAPDEGEDGVRQAVRAAKAAYESGHVKAAHPNFVRVLSHVEPSAPGGQPLWNHRNDGNPGVPGADVAADAAWLISRGKADVRVAVLDEGVDTTHPALQPAVADQKDFVDGNANARPSGDDAHGTACAGIIVSQAAQAPGLAPNCRLVAVRIAKGVLNPLTGRREWLFVDSQTADAIDWSWRDGKADVLSNSWGGGPEVDIITRAFRRARTQGRDAKGAVVAVATGNSDGPVQYPATIPQVLAVGASNPWDRRKTRTSEDGENWWGSCCGPELSLLAPGVRIATTDIQGAAGYNQGGDFVVNFNGTSSATPHVAAAAALILSVRPDRTEKQVRELITGSADRLTPTGKRNNDVGSGRLNLFAALRLARR